MSRALNRVILVLFVVGSVNRDRIENFKRTRQYRTRDYDLLVRVMGKYQPLCSVAHVLAEVSNLTDLAGEERTHARRILNATFSLLTEVSIGSERAAQDPLYQDLGLTDAAIGAIARLHHCAVLTDDLNLYLRLSKDLTVINFNHLRAAELEA